MHSNTRPSICNSLASKSSLAIPDKGSPDTPENVREGVGILGSGGLRSLHSEHFLALGCLQNPNLPPNDSASMVWQILLRAPATENQLPACQSPLILVIGLPAPLPV